MKKIGFIGIGVMGLGMARNLRSHGYEVAVYTRTKAKAQPLLQEGAEWCDDVASCCAGRNAVITMVGYPEDVEQVYFGAQGIIQNANPGTYIIDMTTTKPALAQSIYQQAVQKGLFALDAPVSGGDIGAQKGTLSIMVGGDEDAYNTCLPLFEAMGSNIVYEGPAGCGQHTKMANQIALGGAIAGVCEAISYARATGLDVDKMLATIGGGAAGSWQLSDNGPRIAKNDFAPGFYIKHYVKDLAIASGEAEAAGLHLDIAEAVYAMYKQLQQQGLGDLGTQALIYHYEKPDEA